jgi:hypothetical protein
MYKEAKFLFFCMIFVVKGAVGQNLNAQWPENKGLFTSKPALQVNYYTYASFQKSHNKKPVAEKINLKPVLLLSPVSCAVISADFYTRNFGFFCKKELQFEKTTKIPLRFRLGSLQYNDYLERKPNAVNPF